MGENDRCDRNIEKGLDRCLFSQLRDKEIVNVTDGARLGFCCDMEIDVSCGRVCALIVPVRSGRGIISKCREVTVPWEAIRKIGDDLILVCLPDGCLGDDRKKRQ